MNKFPKSVTRMVRLAAKEAEKSTFKFRIGAIIVKGKKIISSGINYENRYRRKLNPKFTRWPSSLHAEVDCIFNARKPLKGLTMIVARLGANDDYRLAKPCPHCEMYIRHVGLSRVIYTVNEPGHFGILEL